MKNKYLSIIPLAGVAAIPQLLFWWLSPEAAACRNAVYAFLTAMTVIHLSFFYFLWLRKGIRRAAAPLLVSSVICTVMLIVAGGLIMLNVDIRSAVFAMSIGATVYLSCTAMLLTTIEPDDSIVDSPVQPPLLPVRHENLPDSCRPGGPRSLPNR